MALPNHCRLRVENQIRIRQNNTSHSKHNGIQVILSVVSSPWVLQTSLQLLLTSLQQLLTDPLYTSDGTSPLSEEREREREREKRYTVYIYLDITSMVPITVL